VLHPANRIANNAAASSRAVLMGGRRFAWRCGWPN